jgi:hypothetical protein
MEAPTPAQIRTAIEVLEKLGERINEHAARSVRQIPPSSVNGQLAGQISSNAMEQTKQVQEINGLLKTWHGELDRQRRQNVSQHI